jgi:hypothetical protein
MWDLQKTLDHVAGVRKRIAEGKPPFTMTPEERQMMDRVQRDWDEARKKRMEGD